MVGAAPIERIVRDNAGRTRRVFEYAPGRAVCCTDPDCGVWAEGLLRTSYGGMYFTPEVSGAPSDFDGSRTTRDAIKWAIAACGPRGGAL